jgi:prolyl-tRNA editing enzyme YbaK/EbsC (Cys-tRNA(Pro) deacylase)
MTPPDFSLSSSNLQTYMNQQKIQATILPMAEHTLTVPDAARALGVESASIIKSLVFLINGTPILMINNDVTRVDPKKVGAYFGVNRKKVKFATPEQALEITGYVVGSMPPFGHLQRLPTYIDLEVLRLDTVYGGGGDIDAMLRLTSAELVRVTAAEIVDVSKVE